MDAYDLKALFAHRDALASLDPAGAPALRAFERPPAVRTVALLPGSFNPPTAAHLLLAERALREGFDCVAFVLARSTAGKENNGLGLEDRLLALRTIAATPGLAVAVTSCGLYADQAEAAAREFDGAELTFLVGSDKVAQILDARWYEDRDAALDRLFSRARILVSPRADDARMVAEMFGSHENRRWSERISVLPLHPAVSDLSSTRVRGLLTAGADPSGLVPPGVSAFLAETRSFAPPMLIEGEQVPAYALRCKLLDALDRERAFARDADMRMLMRLALDPGEEGRRLRQRLLAADGTLADLQHAHAVAAAAAETPGISRS